MVTLASAAFADERSVYEKIRDSWNPLASDQVEIVQAGLKKTIQKCNRVLTELSVNIYALEEAEKPYYASVNRAQFFETQRKCSKKIAVYKKRIQYLQGH